MCDLFGFAYTYTTLHMRFITRVFSYVRPLVLRGVLMLHLIKRAHCGISNVFCKAMSWQHNVSSSGVIYFHCGQMFYYPTGVISTVTFLSSNQDGMSFRFQLTQ